MEEQDMKVKAIEAPEKIYVSQQNGSHSYRKNNDDDIQYVKVDAFIKKACKWLRKHKDRLHCMIFGHIWCADGLPNGNGVGRQFCDICKKERFYDYINDCEATDKDFNNY